MKNKIQIDKAGALCIQGNKLLVVSEKGLEYYISLGGEINPSETDIACLKREVKEEVSCDIKKAEYFATFFGRTFDGEPLRLQCYLVELEGNPHLNPDDNVDRYCWVNREDYSSQRVPLAPLLKDQILPALIQGGFLR